MHPNSSSGVFRLSDDNIKAFKKDIERHRENERRTDIAATKDMTEEEKRAYYMKKNVEKAVEFRLP